ncbi:chloride channel protein [Planctomyces sp. SH-PL62]|uniref:chloride channel protein n=1 Tax=Planctomyces sp. SH-PL62 TaxID=1636152 RepID=UPI00078B4960|nr:chloride channel protein [Planctomyces sp. SH-PL62]AMV38886.1 H(+)/Cl(-) exchange transporter ClcA [Planctomyces sp. SH-PL62]
MKIDPIPSHTPPRAGPPSKLAAGVARLAAFWATPGVGRAGLCSPLVGVVAGLGAVFFLKSLQFMYAYVLGGLMHFTMPPTLEGETGAISYPWPWWMTVLVPTVGGLISGWLVFAFAPEAEGHGTDAMIRAFHRGGGMIRTRVPFIKTFASIITIGTGGSAGQEGPIAQIGSGFGSYLARLLRLPADERRILMLAGAAGGVGAIFRAPLGGALFAGEVLYSSTAFESAALLPCLASAIVAYSTFALFVTPMPVFSMPPLSFQGLRDLPLYIGLTLLCAAVGWLYTRVFYGMRDRVFKPMPIPRMFKPAVGGAMLGLLALAFPQVMAGGYGWVQWGAIGEPAHLLGPGESAFVPNMSMGLLFGVALLKIVATGFTISSGGSGGVFGPSMLIGGMLGGGYAQLVHSLGIGQAVEPSAFVLVGMGGFFAGVSKTPLTSIVMVSEMTGSYSLLVPLMLACALNMALSRRWTLYEEQVATPIDSPAHQGDFVIDVLSQLRVGEAGVRSQGIEVIPAALSFDRLLQKVARSSESLFPVVDGGGALTGVFTLRDLRLALLGSDSWGRLVVADDLATRPVSTVTVDDDLHTALRRMTELNIDEIPVVDPEDPARLIGLLSRRSLTTAYTSLIKSLRGDSTAADVRS